MVACLPSFLYLILPFIVLKETLSNVLTLIAKQFRSLIVDNLPCNGQHHYETRKTLTCLESLGPYILGISHNLYPRDALSTAYKRLPMDKVSAIPPLPLTHGGYNFSMV